MLGTWLLACSGALILVATPPQPDGYKVIVNPLNPTSSLTRAQLSRMFLEPPMWPDGQPVLPVDLPAASPLRELFSHAVHGMSASAVLARLTGAPARSGRTPMTLSSDADVIQYVRLKRGAIGYVSAAADVSAVRVVSIDFSTAADPSDASDDAIQAVLTGYAAAVQRSDMGALKRLWPTMTGAQILAQREEFAQGRTVKVELLDPKVDVKGDAAIVTARRRSVVMTSSGTTTRVVMMTTLRLRHALGRWAIEDIRHQPER